MNENKKEKTKKTKKSLKTRFNETIEWCEQHKDILMVGVPLVATSIVAVTKFGGKLLNTYNAKTLQDRYIYDRSLGHYWRLKRPLSNNQMLLISKRRNEGEALCDILASMKVLK